MDATDVKLSMFSKYYIKKKWKNLEYIRQDIDFEKNRFDETLRSTCGQVMSNMR